MLCAVNFDLLPFAEAHDEQRILELAAAVGSAIWLCAQPRARAEWLELFLAIPRAGRWTLAAVCTAGLASALRSAAPRTALFEVGHAVLLFCFTLAVGSGARRLGRRFDQVTAAAIALAAALFLASFALDFGASMLVRDGQPPETALALRRFSHVRFFGQWQTWTLPLVGLGAVLLPAAPQILRLAFDGLAAGWWFLLFVTGTRGTILAVASALAFTALARGPASWPWVRRQALLAASGMAAYVGLYVVMASDWTAFFAVLSHVASLSDSGRSALWSAALASIRSHPLLGMGPGQFALIPGVRAAHPHNAWLQWAAEWGIPSTVAVTVLLLGALRGWLRARPGFHDDPIGFDLHCALTVSLVGASVHALVCGIIVMPVSQISLVLVAGWALGLHLRAVPEKARTDLAGSSLLAWVVVTATAMTIACAWPPGGATWFEHRPGPAGEPERFRPRLWQRPPPSAQILNLTV